MDTAVAAGTFQTLAKALQAADLVDTLKGAGPFTVFAPTDEAFAKLPAGTLDHLLKPENKEKLRAILTYHVVAGKVASAKVVTLTSVKTVNGQEVKITATGGNVMVSTCLSQAPDGSSMPRDISMMWNGWSDLMPSKRPSRGAV